jgi:hypothetical protein
MAPLRCVTAAVLVVREGALAVPARGGSGKRRSTGPVAAAFNRWSEQTPTQRLSGVQAAGRARVASGPAEDQSAALYSRGLRLANELFDQNCQLSSLNIPSKGTHFTARPAHTSGIRGFCGLPLARSAVTTVRPCTRARAITNGSATDLLRRVFTNCGNFARISVALA